MARRRFSDAFPNHKRLWSDLSPTGKGKTGINEILTDPQGLGISNTRLGNWRQGKGFISDAEERELRRIHAIRDNLRVVWPISEPQGRGKRRSYESRKQNVRKLYRAWGVQGDWRSGTGARGAGGDASKDIIDALVALGVDTHRPETYVQAYYG